MEKLEEIEPNRRHLSGFYWQQGHQLLAGGKRMCLCLSWSLLTYHTKIRVHSCRILRCLALALQFGTEARQKVVLFSVPFISLEILFHRAAIHHPCN